MTTDACPCCGSVDKRQRRPVDPVGLPCGDAWHYPKRTT